MIAINASGTHSTEVLETTKKLQPLLDEVAKKVQGCLCIDIVVHPKIDVKVWKESALFDLSPAYLELFQKHMSAQYNVSLEQRNKDEPMEFYLIYSKMV